VVKGDVTTSIYFRAANVVIAGGSEGIGRELAARFIGTGSTVLMTGRNTSKLERAARE
jgi:uncharacterized oxidoreductase